MNQHLIQLISLIDYRLMLIALVESWLVLIDLAEYRITPHTINYLDALQIDID